MSKTNVGAAAPLALASLSLSMLLSSLGTSVANVGLPALAEAFGASFPQVQWVVLAYLLAVTTLIVSAGRLGDLVGRRRLLLGGVLLFTAASLLCGLAPALWLLVAARAAQGLGAALMMTLSLALVAETVPKERTGGAMGLLGTTSAIGTALGPSLGGVLIAALGWRAMFLALAPLGLLTLLLAHRHLPLDRRAVRDDAPGFDHAGTILLALTLGAYALATTLGDALQAPLLGAAVVALGLFVLVEARARSPLLRLTTLREPALSGGLATSALVSTVLMTTLVVGPFHLSRALALDPATVGLVMSTGPLVAALTGVPAGRLVDRLGAPRVSLAGLLGLIAGTFALSLTPASLGVPGYVVPLAVVTSSYAAFQAANNTAVMSDRRPDQRGVVAGLLNLARNLGLVTGASVMGAVFARAAAAVDVTTASAEAVASATRTTFAVAAVVSVVALVISAGAQALAKRASGCVACSGPRVARLLVVGLAVLALGGPATATNEATAPEASRALSDAPIKLGLFYVESAGGEHRLALNGRLMVDGRFAGRDDDGHDDGFQVRRGRLDVSGRIAKVVTFKLGLELGRPGGADLRDAYLNLGVVDWLQLRAGQMLVPFSTEGLTSSSYMKLPERPIIVGNLADSREVGLMVHGQAFRKRLAYAAAIFNGNGQNRASDDDDAKDAALRLEVAPIGPLLLAVSYRYTPTNREGSRGPSDVRTVGNQLTRFLDYDSSNNRHRSSRERGSIDARVRAGPLEVKGEVLFDRWRGVVSGTGARDDLLNWGWFVDASYVLTGEDSQDMIEPARPFHGEGALGPGAWELSARYEEFHADRATLTEGFAVGARSVRATSMALTWIPVARVRVQLSYTYSDLDRPVVDSAGDRRGDDHAVIARLGLWF